MQKGAWNPLKKKPLTFPVFPTPEGWTPPKGLDGLEDRLKELFRLQDLAQSPNPQEAIEAQIQLHQNTYGNAAEQFDAFYDNLAHPWRTQTDYGLTPEQARAMVTRAYQTLGIVPVQPRSWAEDLNGPWSPEAPDPNFVPPWRALIERPNHEGSWKEALTPLSSWLDLFRTDWHKTTTWTDIVEKAQRLRGAGQVTVLRNTPTLVVGRVIGDHGTYTTEIHRQDPNQPLAVSDWSCECPWGEKWAWQRTRQWKRYEGRLCAHATGLLWQGMSLPYDDEGQDMGGQQPPPGGAPVAPQPQPMAPAPQQAPQLPPALSPGILGPGTMPAGPPIPGAANPPIPGLPGAVQIAPNQVPAPAQAPAAGLPGVAPGGAGVSSQPIQPGQGGTVSIPGALSSWSPPWKEAMVERSGDIVEGRYKQIPATATKDVWTSATVESPTPIMDGQDEQVFPLRPSTTAFNTVGHQNDSSQRLVRSDCPPTMTEESKSALFVRPKSRWTSFIPEQIDETEIVTLPDVNRASLFDAEKHVEKNEERSSITIQKDLLRVPFVDSTLTNALTSTTSKEEGASNGPNWEPIGASAKELSKKVSLLDTASYARTVTGWNTLDEKRGMSERSGDPQLDALIEQFSKRNLEYGYGEMPVADLRQNSDGMCQRASQQLCHFLISNGIDAAIETGTPDNMGYQDRQWDAPDSGHMFVVATTATGTYTIDFAATQYGYSEFPMVQKADGDELQREWTSATERPQWMIDTERNEETGEKPAWKSQNPRVPEGYQIDPEFNCFTNAENLCDLDPSLSYTEGMTTIVGHPDQTPGEHAWAVTPEGEIVDPYFEWKFPGQQIDYKPGKNGQREWQSKTAMAYEPSEYNGLAELSERARNIVAKYHPQIDAELNERWTGDVPGDCRVACYFWQRAFEQEGLPSAIHVGNVYVDNEAEWHVWLTVEHKPFDPTAAQFGQPLLSFDAYDWDQADEYPSAGEYADSGHLGEDVHDFLGPMTDGQNPVPTQFPFHYRQTAAKLSSMQISVVNGDITQLHVDAIVNAANGELILGSGVAGAIRQKGGPTIQDECHQKSPIETGQAVETTAGDLPSKYVIHAVTMEHSGGETSAEIISQATTSSLALADQLGCHSIAIPAFGTGIGGFSLQECAQLMLAACNSYTPSTLSKVIFSVWGEEAEQIFTQALEQPEWKSSTWKYSAFRNGDMVRANQEMEGQDRDGNTVPITRNSVGEVLTSDEITTVVIFPLHTTGQLEPHLVKVEDFTASFSPSNTSPFIRRRRQSAEE